MKNSLNQRLQSSSIALALMACFGCSTTSQVSNVEQGDNPFEFRRSLSWQSYTFDVSSTKDTLTIKTGNETHTDAIDSTVTAVEVGDLNTDGYPEIVVFLTSVGSGSYGSVVGYSSNRGQSMSRISTALATEEGKHTAGYMGHDKLSLVEGTLVQSFPVFRDGDPAYAPTGPMRQIQYGMADGEASRKLVVRKVVEYPNK